jgi:hypothetical protein
LWSAGALACDRSRFFGFFQSDWLEFTDLPIPIRAHPVVQAFGIASVVKFWVFRSPDVPITRSPDLLPPHPRSSPKNIDLRDSSPGLLLSDPCHPCSSVVRIWVFRSPDHPIFSCPPLPIPIPIWRGLERVHPKASQFGVGLTHLPGDWRGVRRFLCVPSCPLWLRILGLASCQLLFFNDLRSPP